MNDDEPETDLDQVKAARDILLDHLRHHHNVNGAGIGKDALGYYVAANLTKPHRWWHRKLPTTVNGWRVLYQVIGEVWAQ